MSIAGPMRVLCVAGARPNYMKIKPVMDALEVRGVDVVLVHTGQHYDPAMNDVFFDELGIRPPDHALGVGSGSHAAQTAKVMTAIEPLLVSVAPDIVVVVGDVNSTVAAALVAAKHGCLVAHVEAGLRSRDWSMPEEVNRLVTDRLSDYLLASSEDAADNLRQEGYHEDQIAVVGNVMVDTLLANRSRAESRDVVGRLGLQRQGFALVTLHRPANVDDPDSFAGLVDALNATAMQVPIVFPVHPRTRAAFDSVWLHDRITLLEPLGYLDFVGLESAARLVLTDSGGVQEETTVLGIPCLTLRDNTERPITVTQGTNRVVGRDPAVIVRAVAEVLASPPEPRRPALWDGHAAERIADVIVSGGRAQDRLRPTDLRAVVSLA